MADDETQTPNAQDTIIIKAYTWRFCDKGTYSPGFSDTGMYYYISVY